MRRLVQQKALDLHEKLGNFNVGKEADFIVCNLKATAVQALRQDRAKNIEDALFALMMMGMTAIFKPLTSTGKKPMHKQTATNTSGEAKPSACMPSITC